MPPVVQAGDHRMIAGADEALVIADTGAEGRANNQVVREQVQEVYGLVVNEGNHK